MSGGFCAWLRGIALNRLRSIPLYALWPMLAMVAGIASGSAAPLDLQPALTQEISDVSIDAQSNGVKSPMPSSIAYAVEDRALRTEWPPRVGADVEATAQLDLSASELFQTEIMRSLELLAIPDQEGVDVSLRQSLGALINSTADTGDSAPRTAASRQAATSQGATADEKAAPNVPFLRFEQIAADLLDYVLTPHRGEDGKVGFSILGFGDFALSRAPGSSVIEVQEESIGLEFTQDIRDLKGGTGDLRELEVRQRRSFVDEVTHAVTSVLTSPLTHIVVLGYVIARVFLRPRRRLRIR